MNDEGVLPSIEEEQRAYNVILKNKECLSVYAYIDHNMVFKKMNIDDFELGVYLGMD
ncbi:hypothetical protein Hanom_Chr16g01432391 [Helianthus anomalus]